MSVRRVALMTALVLGGCDHTAPFAAPGVPDPGPRGTGNPLRVTYNVGTDLRPTWLPDGSGFFYSRERTDRSDRDRCFARMAARGGSVLEQICDPGPASDDSIATFEWAAVAADGRLAYLRAGTPLVPATLAPRTLELRLGTRSDPTGALVRAFPYTASSGSIHQSFSFLQWAGSAGLLYLADNVQYPSPCPGCAPDTLRTGIEVVTLDLATGVPVPVPGTAGAGSAALVGTDTLYYTRFEVIERQILSTGAVSLVHQFGMNASDVTAGGGRLAVVTEPGVLWLIRPGASPVPLTTPVATYFKRPALSPDGRRLIAEGYPQVSPTTLSRSADLWLFELP